MCVSMEGNAFSISEAVNQLSLVYPFFFFDRTGSNPKIRRNKIWGGQNGGILVYNSGEKQKHLFSFIFCRESIAFFPQEKNQSICWPLTDRQSVASVAIANVLFDQFDLSLLSLAALIMKHEFVFQAWASLRTMRSLTMLWQECGSRRTATPPCGGIRSTMAEMVASVYSMEEEVTN